MAAKISGSQNKNHLSSTKPSAIAAVCNGASTGVLADPLLRFWSFFFENAIGFFLGLVVDILLAVTSSWRGGSAIQQQLPRLLWQSQLQQPPRMETARLTYCLSETSYLHSSNCHLSKQQQRKS